MVRFIRYIILIALLQAVAGIFLSHAQSFTSASGIVKDSITGEPLPFVSVYFDGSTIGAMTDDNGTFTHYSASYYFGCDFYLELP